jgi:hypothetical protein
MTYLIYKKIVDANNNEMFELQEELTGTISDLTNRLAVLREDGNEYSAESPIPGGSKTVEV